jgi:SAM-dependent methyltransferase
MNERAGFKDHFSGHASAYADARPRYPEALYDWLAAQCPARALACDVGCGNGQASVALAERFEAVIASDPSAAQIANAVRHPRVAYRVEAAEALSVAPASGDLLTVAQALHWFDFEPFFARAREVLKPDGVFAAWSYGVMRITPPVNEVLQRFEHERVGKYWPPERRHVDAAYATIAFPFERIATPAFAMTQVWSAAQALAYLGTWSAVQRHDKATGTSAIDALRPELEAAWGDPETRRTIEWPLLVWVGRRSAAAQ